MPGKIFVNYRRDDSASHALNVAQYLEATFGKSHVFLDIDRMRAGQSFPTVLKERLSASKVMLAVIGPSWLTLKGEDGQRRIDDPSDWVRLEIATALTSGTVVIPVLVGGAALPRKSDLPPVLQALTDQHAVTVTTNGFRNEMAGLARDIRAIPGPLPWSKIGGGTAAVLAIALGGWGFAYQLGVPVWWPVKAVSAPPVPTPSAPSNPVSDTKGQTPSAKATDEKARADREAKLIADAEARVRDEIAAKQKAEAEQRQREAAAKAEAERQRLAALKVEEDRQRIAADAKRKADEEAARRVPQVGQSFRDCNDGCPEMVVVPAGSFTMGSPANEAGRSNDDEGPQRTVTIRQPFAVGKFEVTFAEWEACVAGGGCTSNRSPSDQGWGKGRRPVINVSWDDAKQYVSWLSRKTGKTYRLLSEAEWEYAARAGTTTRYSWGNDIDCSKASYDGGEKSACYYNPGGKFRGTQPVGNYAANKFGLHDMHGNVWEWVEDCYADSYKGAPADGSAARDVASCRRVHRGGSWGYDPDFLRSAFRGWYSTDFRLSGIGLRVGRTLTP